MTACSGRSTSPSCHPVGPGSRVTSFALLGLVEATKKGQRLTASWLGLGRAAAVRYHGLSGHGSRDSGRRWPLLRTLQHTLGVNDVFVAMAMAADLVRGAGGTDQLAEWRSAAACERRQCKPNGYGCYKRDGRAYGFFVEFDRGTEGRQKYAAKLRAYYRVPR